MLRSRRGGSSTLVVMIRSSWDGTSRAGVAHGSGGAVVQGIRGEKTEKAKSKMAVQKLLRVSLSSS